MNHFVDIEIEWGSAKSQLDQFRQLLLDQSPMKERETLLPFFKDRPQLCALSALIFPEIFPITKYANEFFLGGRFRPDFVVGSDESNHYAFVELENAEENSVFVQEGDRFIPRWSPRFMAGFGQIADWMWYFEDIGGTTDVRRAFNRDSANVHGALVIGRDHFMHSEDLKRLEWFRSHNTIRGRTLALYTYDGFYRTIKSRVDMYEKLPGMAAPVAIASAASGSQSSQL